jgi:hypothetical protein
VSFVVLTPAIPAAAQAPEPVRVTTVSYGTLNQNDLALRLRNEDLEIRFIPLDPKITRLLANDAFQSLRSVMETRRRAIDSVASREPQTLTVRVRNRVLQPLGVIPIDARFTSQQLNLREQASAIYLFEEDLPVDDSFSLSYGALTSDDWQAKQSLIDRERARVSARARAGRPDTTR